MKAVYIEEQGGPEVLRYGDFEEPSIGPNEVKVKIRAVSINRLDIYARAGDRGMKRDFPPSLILGGDSSGDVSELGDNVNGLSIGQRVIINPKISCDACEPCFAGAQDLCRKSQFLGTSTNGSYAEYVAVPAVNVHPIPDSISYEEAAAIPTTYMPAWNILIRKAELKPWETVLVLSASGGVGTAAVQVSKNVVGAQVIATTSNEEKCAKALELGADHVINYNDDNIMERVKELTGGKGVDVVVDHVGADFFQAAFRSLKPGGRYGICGVTTGYKVELHTGALFTKQICVFGVQMGSREDMRQIIRMLGTGKIRPVIHKTFPLNQAADAHRLMEEINFFGKIILKP